MVKLGRNELFLNMLQKEQEEEEEDKKVREKKETKIKSD